MESIRIQNVRNLKDTGSIQLLPINILVGQNSSGRFLAFLPSRSELIITFYDTIRVNN